MTKTECLNQFRQIPGVGSSIAEDIYNLGFRSIDELRGQNPEEMYFKLCALEGKKIDRCMLYVFRCAVYFASTPNPDPKRLKWWNWKDGNYKTP